MLFHHCPPPLSRGRQSNEPSPRPKILLETRRSSTSLVPPTDLPARLEPDLWSKSPVLHKNPKTAVKAWVSHWRLAQSAIICRENILASYSNPRKTREALQFALKKKLLRFGFGVFGGCRQGWGMFYYFWLLFYDVITRTMSRNCGSKFGCILGCDMRRRKDFFQGGNTRGVVGWERRSHTSFWRVNAFPHLFALATLLEDVGSERLH